MLARVEVYADLPHEMIEEVVVVALMVVVVVFAPGVTLLLPAKMALLPLSMLLSLRKFVLLSLLVQMAIPRSHVLANLLVCVASLCC